MAPKSRKSSTDRPLLQGLPARRVPRVWLWWVRTGLLGRLTKLVQESALESDHGPSRL